MTRQGLVAIVALSLLLGACASAPQRPVRTEFEDIPVPKGLAYQADDSSFIETANVKAVRYVYRGRLEPESLATAIRGTLEANGWRFMSSTRTKEHGAIQVYEKEGDSLHVQVSEGLWYTYAEYSTGRVVKRPK